MGVTVRQKNKGRGQPWWVFIHLNGTIRSKKLGDKRAAEAVASAVRRKLKAGQLNLETVAKKNTIPTFAEYSKCYMERYAKIALKRNTWKGYEAIFKQHLNPAWAEKRLDEITRANIKTLLLQKLELGYAPQTVNNIRIVISGVLNYALEEEIIQFNNASKLGRMIKKGERKEHITPLTKEQAVKFMDTVKDESLHYYPLFLCVFRTGVRLGELIGLAWEDINFDSNTIKVQRSYSHRHFSTPKSHKYRLIDMSNQLRKVLLDYRAVLIQKFRGKLPICELPGKKKGVHLVFCNRDGGVLDGDNLRHRVFYPLLEKADIPKVRFHDIRHTFASLLLQQGESLAYVRDQMGHASIMTTVDIYGHLVPGANRNAVNRLDDEDFRVPALRIADLAT